jgi:hypothetical protein
MSLPDRVWGFLHPDQWIKLEELKDLAQDLRFLLAESNAAVRNAHMTRQEREQSITKNQRMLKTLEKITGRLSSTRAL